MVSLDIASILGILGTALALVYGYIQNSKLRAAINVAQKFAQQGTTYLRIKADGHITVEEKVAMGDAAIEFFEAFEEATGSRVVNTKEVAWIKPAEPSYVALEEVLPEEVGTFEPRLYPAEQSGLDKNGQWVRGLKMPIERFNNMVHGHSETEKADMRRQVDEAEAAGLRGYMVKFGLGYYLVENGIVIGGAGSPVKG